MKDTEHQLNTLNEESLKTGLMIHKGKTKFMTNIDTTDNIQTNRTEIVKATNYKYLGQTIAMENRTKQEILIKIKAGWGVFWKVQGNLSGQASSHESKKERFLTSMSYQQ